VLTRSAWAIVTGRDGAWRESTRRRYAGGVDERDAIVGPVGSFRERVLAVVRAVPPGRVVTYGQVALLAGSPRAARQVGGVLYGSGSREGVPWQRVVNAAGGISTHKIGAGELQEALLRAEGVEVGPSGVDLRRYRWSPGTATLMT
jgi:methylated-DNA-protein-cysteine methyltransferase related protein